MVIEGKTEDGIDKSFPNFRPPGSKTLWESIYDADTHQFMGRTGKGWAEILAAYVCLFTFLTGLFFALLSIAQSTYSSNRPKWTLDDSIIGVNPGIGYRPLFDSLFVIDRSDSENIASWKNAVEDFLRPYSLNQDARQLCDYEKPINRSDSTGGITACGFSVPEMVNCTAENDYGYSQGNPCIFLKMNKIIDWEPEPYNHSDILSNQTGMPEDLQDYIVSNENSKSMANNVWLSCDAEDTATGDSVKVAYEGPRGFPTYYYPYTNQKNYISPFIVVQLTDLPTGHVELECRLWAKNIVADKQLGMGMVVIHLHSR